MKLIAVLAIVAVTFGNRAKATTPAGEAENSIPGTNVSTTPNPSSENSTTNVSTTPTPTNSTTNVTITPNPTNSTTNVTTTPNPTNSTTNVTTTPNPTSANSTTNGSTTPKPITILPTPPPSPGEFSLKENGSYCILARFFAEFYITFRVNSGGGKTTEKTLNQTLRRGSNVTISGNCGSINGSTLVISWPKNESSYTLTMKFTNTSRNNWLLSLLTFNVAVDKIHDFANATVKGEVKSTYNGSQESSPHGQVGGSYLCNDTVPFVLNNTEKHFKVMATFQDFRVQPFANASMGNDFNKGTECTQDTTTAGPTTSKKTSDVIPIAVGCALAGLVLIVLIAYVIGRRKSHSGYEKV